MSAIHIKNLRSIREATIQVAPITVLYGPNGSGKSTVMHSLAILKNIILNPNQSIDNFFNLGFSSFGGFEQVIFNHNLDNQIEISIGLEGVSYQVIFGKGNGLFRLSIGKPWDITLKLEITFPYPANQQKSVVTKDGHLRVSWNGILGQVTPIKDEETLAADEAKKLATILNRPIEMIRKSDFVHLKRGFSKPHYGTVALTPTIFMEDEIATLLATDQYLEGQVSHYLEQILQRDFRVRVIAGTNLFWLNTIDKTTGVTTELVNDGFGINQVVYLLAKCLRSDTEVVCIEEPEIHLHPKALRNLAYALIRIIKEIGKIIIISTHSEHFVLALLAAVSKEELSPDNLSCYLCTKDKHESKFEYQQVNSNGQIEGGLASFMEGELEDLKDILEGVKE